MVDTTGSLASKPLAHLLAYALDGRLTGTLELARPGGADAATIVIRQGAIAKIKTTNPVAYLGSVLYELGFIDAVELNASLLELSKKRVLHGELLVARGSITHDQLASGLREQTLRKLAHTFTFDNDAMFAFRDEVDLLASYGGGSPVLVDLCPALWRGIREFPSAPHVRTMIERMGAFACRLARDARIERFHFSTEELAVVNCLGIKALRIGELTELGILPPTTTELLVYCLLITKQVELIDASAVAPSTTSISMPRMPAIKPGSRPSMPAVRPGVASATAVSQTNMPAVKDPAAGTTLESVPPVRPRPPSGSPAAHAAQKSSRPPRSGPVRSATPRPQLSAQMLARAEVIQRRARAIVDEDYFERLCVPRDATPEQIERQFTTRASHWDVDALPPELDVVREECQRVRDALVEAHQTLMDSRKRNDYIKELLLGRTYDPAEDLAMSGAENEFEGAKACLARHDIDRAERLARRAHKAKPDQAAPLALLAWVEASRPQLQGTVATKTRIAMLDRALALDPECVEALNYRWQLHKRAENHNAAMKDLQRLLAINPNNVEAERELRIYEMRVRKGSLTMRAVNPSSSGVRAKPSPSGLFGRLLKK